MREETPSYFSVLPASVRYDNKIPAGAKLIFAEVTSLCSKEGYCWASNQYFATLYGVTRQAVSKWISALAKAGHVNVRLITENKACSRREIRLGGVNTGLQVSTPVCGGCQHTIAVNNTSINNIPPTPKGRVIEKPKLIPRKPQAPAGNPDGFDIFWKAYERKGSKRKAAEVWVRMSEADQCKATEAIPAYFSEKENPRFRKDAERYLRDKIFADVLERKAEGSQSTPGETLGLPPVFTAIPEDL